MRKCKLCQSTDLRPRQQVCDKCRAYNCENCGKDMMRTPKEIKGNKRFCSVKCAQSSPTTKKKIEDKNKELYGGTGFQAINKWEDKSEEEKAAQVNKMRKGLREYVSDEDNLKAMRKKAEATNIQRYGAKSPLSGESSVRKLAEDNRDMKEIHRKSQITKSAWSQSKRDEIHSRISATNKETWDNTDEETKLARADKISKARIKFFEEETYEERKARRENHKRKLNDFWDNMDPAEKNELIERRQKTLSKSTRKRVSHINKRWGKLIESKLGVTPTYEKNVNGMNYDLYVGNVLIDINPTVSHNSDVNFAHFIKICNKPNCKSHPLMSETHHLNRAKNADDDNYDWMFLFDHVDEKKAIGMLRNKLSLNERSYSKDKIHAKVISNSDGRDFINENYIQDEHSTPDVSIGLFIDEDELVAVMTLKSNEDSWIIMNYSNKYNVDVKDGELIAFDLFKSIYNPLTVKYSRNYNYGCDRLTKLIKMNSNSEPIPVLSWSHLKFSEYIRDNESMINLEDSIELWANENKLSFFKVGNDFDDFKERGGEDEFGYLYESNQLDEGLLPTDRMIASHYGFVRVFDAGEKLYDWIPS